MEEVKLSDVFVRVRIFVLYAISQWKIVLLVGMLGAAAAGSYGYLKKPKFTASVTFTLDGEYDASSGLMSLAAQFGFDAGGVSSMFSGNNLLQFIKSRKLIEKTLLQHHAGENETYADQFIKLYKIKARSKPIELPCFKVSDTTVPTTPFQDSIMSTIVDLIQKKHLVATIPDRKTDIYQVDFTSNDPKLSIQFVQALMDNLGTMYTSVKTAKSAKNVRILEEKVDSLRAIISGAIQKRAATVDANLNPVFQSPMTSVQERQIEISIATAAIGEVAKNLEVSRFLLMKQAPLFSIIDEPKLPLKRQKISTLVLATAGGLLSLLVLAIYWLLSKPFQSFTQVYIKEKNK